MARSLAASLVLLALPSTGCRAIIGVDSVSYDPDAATRDGMSASDAPVSVKREAGMQSTLACPTSLPTAVFTVTEPLSNPFVGGDHIFAMLFALDDQEVPAIFSGFIGCPKTGCSAPQTLQNLLSVDGGVTFGYAAATDGGVYYSVPNGMLSGNPDDAGAGTLRIIGLDGGPDRALVSRLDYPFLVTVSGDDLYWTDDATSFATTNNMYPWAVWHATIDGGTPELLFRGPPGNTIDLFVDATNVYVVGEDDDEDLGLFVCKRSGCGGSAPEQVSGIQQSNNSNGLVEVDSFASDGTSLFHSVFSDGTIVRTSLSGSEPTTLIKGQTGPWGLAVDATYLYWVTTTGVLARAAKDGSGSIAPLACGLTNITGFAIDSSRAYVLATDPANLSNTAMFSVPIDPSP